MILSFSYSGRKKTRANTAPRPQPSAAYMYPPPYMYTSAGMPIIAVVDV